MSLELFTFRSTFPRSAEQLFAWHERLGAFDRLNPPWDSVKVIKPAASIQDGSEIEIGLKMGPIPLSWRLKHIDYIKNSQFKDVQVCGPFKSWCHTHSFTALSNDSSQLEDKIEFELPFGQLGKILGSNYTKSKLETLFRYRHLTTANDLECISRYPNKPLKILVSGASGLVGTALVSFLRCAGHSVYTLVRRTALTSQEIYWNPDSRSGLKLEQCGQLDAVFHLSGENVATGLWTEAKKTRIEESRVKSTSFLADTLAQLKNRPPVLICASAIGFYGDRAAEELNEESSPGHGFLADVCKRWEEAAAPAAQAGIRVCHPRIGIVLSAAGGALQKMLLPFQLGLGGKIGPGTQYMSCVFLDDLIYAFYHMLFTQSLEGPINMVGPEPITNSEFTRQLGDVLRRPTFCSVPAAILKTTLGEMGQSLLLTSARIFPRKLLDSGFQFKFAQLKPGLAHVLGKSGELTLAGFAQDS